MEGEWMLRVTPGREKEKKESKEMGEREG